MDMNIEYNVGQIIRNRWFILSVSNEVIRFKCLECGYEYEGDSYFLKRKNSCIGCNQLKYNAYIGQTFERLTVLRILEERSNRGHILTECQCICGNKTIVPLSSIKSGHTRSCGCLEAEGNNYAHRLSGTRIYKIWKGIKTRCYNQNHHTYAYYGARGIRMCDEWYNDFMSFYTWSMENGYNDSLSIDRINPNGHYEPNNCRWVTQKEQQYNKQNSITVNYYGERSLLDLARLLNVSPSNLKYYYENGKLDEFIKAKERSFARQLFNELRKK